MTFRSQTWAAWGAGEVVVIGAIEAVRDPKLDRRLHRLRMRRLDRRMRGNQEQIIGVAVGEGIEADFILILGIDESLDADRGLFLWASKSRVVMAGWVDGILITLNLGPALSRLQPGS